MPNTNKIQELVRAFNIILAFDETVITNFTVKSIKRGFLSKDHIVVSFDKNMNVSQCMKYLNNMKERMIENFCGDESGASKLFNTKFFPFNFDQGKWTKDNKFLVPMKDEVVYNLKSLLANNLEQFAIGAVVAEENFRQDYVDENMSDRAFDRKSYLHCISFNDQELQNSFVKMLSSQVEGCENGPKDFLKVKEDLVYIKKDIFNNSKLIQDIVKDRVSLVCRDFQTSRNEEGRAVLKFAVVDLIREALPDLPISDMWHTSHIESEGEYSILAPVTNDGDYMGFLNEEEVDHINNKVFGGVQVLRDLKDYIAGKKLPTYGQRKIYAIDFANVDISYCVMNKIIETSVINKEHGLSIDSARVPVMPFSQEKEINGSSKKHKLPMHGQSRSLDNGDFCNGSLYGGEKRRETHSPYQRLEETSIQERVAKKELC